MTDDKGKLEAAAQYGNELAEKTMREVREHMYFESRDLGLALAVAQICLLLVKKGVATAEEFVELLGENADDMFVKTAKNEAFLSGAGVAMVDFIRSHIAEIAGVPITRS